MNVSFNVPYSSIKTSLQARAFLDPITEKTNAIAQRALGHLTFFAGFTLAVCAYMHLISLPAALAGGTALFLASILAGSDNGNSRYPHTAIIRNVAQQNGFVAFYDKRDPKTEFLGNFHLANFVFGGNRFRCAEAAFQAGKEPSRMAEFANLDGEGAFRLGKTVRPTSDWISGGRNIIHMRNVLQAKFQNPQLKELLLATGDAYLLEHCPLGRDKFWADNGDGTGQNMLGKLLMDLRRELGGEGNVKRLPADAYIKLANSPLR